MRIFDTQIRSDTRSDADLKNLSYFDTARVITTAHGGKNFERADQLISYLTYLTSEEVRRLEQCNLEAGVAVGVLPDARPSRAHGQFWREFPFLLKESSVLAVGEIGVWRDNPDEWELFERQARMALEADGGPLPLIITPPKDLRVNMTYKMMQSLQSLEFPPELAIMNRLDERLIEPVVEEGFVAGVSVGESNINPREAAHLLGDVMESLGSASRIVMNTSMRAGGCDVLGIPKTVVELQTMGIDAQVIDKLIYRNAMGIFY